MNNVRYINKETMTGINSDFQKQNLKFDIQKLKEAGVQLEVSAESLENLTDKLQGKVFVVSGVFHQMSRNELKKAIEDNGGKVSSSISKKTTYIVAGDNMGPSKLTKAESLEIPIISEQDFIDMIN